MGLWSRIKKDFKGNPRAYWFALCTILLTLFFFSDLAFYYAFGEDYTLSAAIRGEVAFVTRRDLVIGVAALLAGIWLSHLFQFGAKPRRDVDEMREENKALWTYNEQLQQANSDLKKELRECLSGDGP